MEINQFFFYESFSSLLNQNSSAGEERATFWTCETSAGNIKGMSRFFHALNL